MRALIQTRPLVCLALVWLAALVSGCRTGHWTIPSELPTYGKPSDNSIQVVVFGRAIERPGIYFLNEGATVIEALQAAHGRYEFVLWRRHYSGIQRLHQNGSRETIWFTKDGRKVEVRMVLQEADWIRFGQEFY